MLGKRHTPESVVEELQLIKRNRPAIDAGALERAEAVEHAAAERDWLFAFYFGRSTKYNYRLLLRMLELYMLPSVGSIPPDLVTQLRVTCMPVNWIAGEWERAVAACDGRLDRIDAAITEWLEQRPVVAPCAIKRQHEVALLTFALAFCEPFQTWTAERMRLADPAGAARFVNGGPACPWSARGGVLRLLAGRPPVDTPATDQYYSLYSLSEKRPSKRAKAADSRRRETRLPEGVIRLTVPRFAADALSNYVITTGARLAPPPPLDAPAVHEHRQAIEL